MKRKSIRKKQTSDSLFSKIKSFGVQFSSFIFGIIAFVKTSLSKKEKDTGSVDLIPPDTFSERASKKAGEISMSVKAAIKQLIVSSEDKIQQALNQAKTKRAFNKAAKKAGKERRAEAKLAASKNKEKQAFDKAAEKADKERRAEAKPAEIKNKEKRAFGKVAKKADKEKQVEVKLPARKIKIEEKQAAQNDANAKKTSADKINAKNNSTEKKKKKIPFYRRVLSLMIKIMIFAMGLIIVFGYVFGLSRNQSLNMQPSFQDGDLVLYLRTYNSYKANDTIVISYENKTMLERVIAVAGDTVDITESGLEVNGRLVQESYAWGETTQFENGVTFPLTVPEGKIFVLGDNREHATDSRVLGCIDEKDVSGSVVGTFRRRNF